jgi:putative DNA primase/helicase
MTDETDIAPDEALLVACAAEPETDIGNGRRFLLRYGGLAEGVSGIAISVAHVGWHVYDGRRWKEDVAEAMIRRLAHKTAEAIRLEAAFLKPDKGQREAIEAGDTARATLDMMPPPKKGEPDARAGERKALMQMIAMADAVKEMLADRRASRHRHAKSSAGSSKISNQLGEAQPYLTREVSDLNDNRYAVNCLSGTIHFVQVENEDSDPESPTFRWDAQLRGHAQGDLITKLVRARWEQGAPPRCPQFLKFMAVVQPNPDVRAFLKRFFGYCLTGLTVEQILVFFYGAGRNGKSTLMDTLVHILDDYAVTLSIDSFSGEKTRSGSEATPDLARLPGARLVSASEPEANVKLKDALIKQLTGGEKIPVRRLHKDFIEVDPQFKILLSGNHKPRIDDDSDGIWRRVALVPWEVQIPKGDVDRLLPVKLKAEADGIFAWMVEGALDYLAGGLDIPDAVRAASQEYREESDPIGAFIRGACMVTGDAAHAERPADLFAAFERYADVEGIFKYQRPTFEKRFATAAKRVWEGPDGDMKKFEKSKSGTTIYRGILIKPEFSAHAGGHPDDR